METSWLLGTWIQPKMEMDLRKGLIWFNSEMPIVDWVAPIRQHATTTKVLLSTMGLATLIALAAQTLRLATMTPTPRLTMARVLSTTTVAFVVATTPHASVARILRLATTIPMPFWKTGHACKTMTAVFVEATIPHVLAARIQKHATTIPPRFWTMALVSCLILLKDALMCAISP
jgi:hypothetical protein